MGYRMKKTCCAPPGCRRHARSNGLCPAHAQRRLTGRPLEPPIIKRVHGTVAKRLRAHLKIDKLTGCHLWTGFRDLAGYGRMRADGTYRLTHRVAWEVKHGPIPEGMLVTHTCDNPPCCNPDHLKLGTHLDNARDRIERGRGPGARARDLELNPQWARVRRGIGLSAARNDVRGESPTATGSVTAPPAKRKRPPRRTAQGP